MRVLALLAIAAFAAGCSLGGEDGGGTSVRPDELEKLVLQPEDLPRGFVQFDEGRQGASDLPQSGERAGPDRFGRQEGWKARYRRPGGARTEGPLVVSSLVDVFESSGGAEDDFEALGSSLREGGLGWQSAEAPELGDEALALRLVQGSAPAEVRFFLIAWRDANSVSSLEVNGFDLELADAVALARKQAARVAAAA